MKEDLIKKIYSLLFFGIIIGFIFVLILPVSGKFTDKLILIIAIILIVFIYVRDKLKFKTIEGWYGTHLLIHPYLLLSILGFATFFINYSGTWISWFYLFVPLCWLIAYLVTSYYYIITPRYVFNFFKFFKVEKIEKIMSEIHKDLDESFENVIFEDKYIFLSRKDNKMIKIPDKSVVIHSSEDKIVVSGKEKKSIKKVIDLINNSL